MKLTTKRLLSWLKLCGCIAVAIISTTIVCAMAKEKTSVWKV